jgi:hypothetical protein
MLSPHTRKILCPLFLTEGWLESIMTGVSLWIPIREHMIYCTPAFSSEI